MGVAHDAGEFRFEDSSGNEIPLAQSIVIRALQGESVDHEEVRLKKPNGETRWLMVGAYKFSNMGLVGVVVFIVDDPADNKSRAASTRFQMPSTTLLD